MRLSWKLFFITTPIFLLFLTIFGTWLIQDSFQDSLDKEMQQCMVENQMFQNSYELTWNGLTQEQREQATMEKMVASYSRKHGDNGGNARIYDQDGKILYQDNSLRLEHSIRDALTGERNVGYELMRQGGQRYAVVLSRSSLGIYMETIRDITSLFDDRDAMYMRYRTGILAMTVLVGGVIFLVLFLMMGNMQKLSRATRQFARGRYDIRVDIGSSDEIGMLAEDFNWMADAMNVQMKQLQDDVHRQEEFTAAFAHELKTPLTSIIGYADTIRQMDLSPEERDMCADYIFRQGKRLQSLSYKLLELAMTDRQEFDERPLRVPQLLEEISKTTKASLTEKKLRLAVQAEDGIIFGDRELLSSVFINLIDNARKASPEGGVIELIGTADHEGYRVIVQDHGRGIPEEELSKITQAFYMVDKSRARKEGGAGLGLALCKKILDLHQAGWRIESEVGSGTRVSVLFGENGETANGRRIRKGASDTKKRLRKGLRRRGETLLSALP